MRLHGSQGLERLSKKSRLPAKTQRDTLDETLYTRASLPLKKSFTKFLKNLPYNYVFKYCYIFKYVIREMGKCKEFFLLKYVCY